MTTPDVEAPRGGAEGRNLFILCIIGVAALLRFYRLTNQSFWFDEGTTLSLTDSVDLVENARRLFDLKGGGERFQPLYNLIVPYWRHAFGDNEFALRSFSALAGTGAVALVVLTAYRVFGPAHAAWTGILAESSSFGVYYSQEARPYALLLFLSSAQVFCLTPVLAGWGPQKPSSSWRRAHVAVVAIGAFGSIFFCLFSTALAVSHLVTFRTPKQWLRWWLPAAIAALPAMVFYFGGGQAIDPANKVAVTRWGYPVIESALFVIYGVLVGTTYGPPLLELHSDHRWAAVRHHGLELLILALVLLSMAVVLARILWKGETGSPQAERASMLLLVTTAVGLGLGTVLAGVSGVTWLPRHSYFLWISATLLIPLVTGARRQGPRWPATALLVLFIGLNLYSLCKYYFQYEYSKDDYRSVARYVMAQENRQTPTILVYGYIRLLRHYGDTRTLDGNSFSPPQLIEKIAEGERGALVILSHEEFWLLRYGASLPALLSPTFACEPAEEFQNFKVYRVSRKGTETDHSQNRPVTSLGTLESIDVERPGPSPFAP
jgi:Dolichyl-phosphate-mannose-protein mannosyltransferase